MKIKSIIDSPCGIRFLIESLPLMSGYSRYALLDRDLMDSEANILEAYLHTDSFYNLLIENPDNKSSLEMVLSKLQELKGIHGTIEKLFNRGILDDIELFEIKRLALISEDIADLLRKSAIKYLIPPSLKEVIEILDPDGLRISSFYIYSSYSERLASIRTRVSGKIDEGEREMLLRESFEIENEIRRGLSADLIPYADLLKGSLDILVELDITIAKGVLMKEMGLNIPDLSSDGTSSFVGMFHPQVKALLEERGGEFQSIDISIGNNPTIIIGANMGGKTVVLKTLAFCQYAFRIGVPIPVKSAKIAIKSDIFLLMGDGQSLESGFSSFASEIKRVDSFLARVRKGENILALIDEPARSTNPIEGSALVTALIRILERGAVSSVITTHYNIEVRGCNRLKVTGLENGKMNYSLSEAPSGIVPHEALEVAKMLEIDGEWIDEADKILNFE